jgi:hypothetical protein
MAEVAHDASGLHNSKRLLQAGRRMLRTPATSVVADAADGTDGVSCNWFSPMAVISS